MAALAGRSDARRSRGELPLLLAGHRTAAEAVAALVAEASPRDFNPAWLLCADRETCWYLDWTGAGSGAPRRLPPGLHVLENHPLEGETPKSAAVRAAVAPLLDAPAPGLTAALLGVLGSHTPPPEPVPGRPPETLAACVHFGPYGTRCASVVEVGEGAPRFTWTDGPPCVNPPRVARWSGAPEG